jgi:hypothetical protein
LSTRAQWLAAALVALGPGAAQAAEAVPPIDAEFLEFLGSLDTEDEEWREYLASRPRPEAGKPAAKPQVKPADAKAPTGKAEQKQDKVKKP